MKNKYKEKEKEFDTVKVFRGIKEKLSTTLSEKTPQQIKEYLKQNSLKFQGK